MSADATQYDVIIIGAGAAGMMCAIEAGKRGRNVWLIDHAKKKAEKIRISGGGRCNFTNIHANPQTFLSENEHFCKSALSQYTQHDFIALVEKHGIAHHEKTLGQLFCDESAQQIINMLVKECEDAGVRLEMETSVDNLIHRDGLYHLNTSRGAATSESLVIATGGLSIPKIGATKFGYEIARQFELDVLPTRPALVPLTAVLTEKKQSAPKKKIMTLLSDIVPKRLAESICAHENIHGRIADLPKTAIELLEAHHPRRRPKPRLHLHLG